MSLDKQFQTIICRLNEEICNERDSANLKFERVANNGLIVNLKNFGFTERVHNLEDGENHRENQQVLINEYLYVFDWVFSYMLGIQKAQCHVDVTSSITSPYFFVPGDAPRSKSARHEGVVKRARDSQSSRRVAAARNESVVLGGDDPLGVLRDLALLISGSQPFSDHVAPKHLWNPDDPPSHCWLFGLHVQSQNILMSQKCLSIEKIAISVRQFVPGLRVVQGGEDEEREGILVENQLKQSHPVFEYFLNLNDASFAFELYITIAALILKFPFYYEIKTILVIWLLSPATKGSSILYRRFVHPALIRREAEIDEALARATEQSYSAVLHLGSKGVNYATTVLMQTAIKVSSGLASTTLAYEYRNDESGRLVR
ncbi:Receptor expression-enhancing protein 1 [Melipona quadrifasciata]|uniref:Receptor expression-enhancing protein n=1 Tax=Melipona quadrifasciata TaxID=166423 RepID=A0A0M9A2Q4_9HYME|nr:Receptor expression-enhancing protein 1 [Melipona quadrifasciata]